jgi:uncharacterized protein (TIRG00374 family)
MMIKNFSRKNTLLIAGLICSAVFGYLALKNFQWNVFYAVVLSVDPWQSLLAVLALVLAFNLRAYRWNFFLPANSTFTFTSRLSAVAVGYLFQNILPGRVGDLVRPAYLAKANRQPYQICLYSVFIERVWELVILLIVALILFRFCNLLNIGKLSINSGIFLIVIIVGVLFLANTKKFLKSLIKITERLKLKFLTKIFKDILYAFNQDFKLTRIFILLILSLAVIFLEGLFFVYLIDSLNIKISFLSKFVVMMITSISLLLPTAPAGIGVFHYFCLLGLTVFGVNSSEALAGAIVIHAFIFFYDVVFGLFCIFFGPLRVSEFFKKTELIELSESGA